MRKLTNEEVKNLIYIFKRYGEPGMFSGFYNEPKTGWSFSKNMEDYYTVKNQYGNVVASIDTSNKKVMTPFYKDEELKEINGFIEYFIPKKENELGFTNLLKI